jgi:hypothetical protein
MIVIDICLVVKFLPPVNIESMSQLEQYIPLRSKNEEHGVLHPEDGELCDLLGLLSTWLCLYCVCEVVVKVATNSQSVLLGMRGSVEFAHSLFFCFFVLF